ncbi:hypothetical protein GYMLUDRAFT_226349 [Collybiopsis luxurians FD-317 M1]|uniref:Unplaced genomic scaffold GYMLUscaffold_29, whole genome shotgun sequence n=1 Tax=Collybiopsis luxurians FD-317 M1 TaxID=944289 RepID=A0A0D0CMZ8_9AGAR|nr:hypothetical protein GYMLUDRAFT_226349 [Collybiopsis luxurians FD-317 M1]
MSVRATTTSSSPDNQKEPAKCPAPTLNFNSSQWIWTTELVNPPNGSAPAGSRAFRKTFSPPLGKTPAFLTIAFTADNAATLWVNGEEIVSEFAWFTAGRYCVDLTNCGCAILIAIKATNFEGPAGVLVDAVVSYTDGSTSSIVSDGSWRTMVGSVPDNFQSLSLDDSSWPLVQTEGKIPVAPWGTVQLAGTDPQSLATAQWIWTTESAPGGNYPPGARAFRYTMTLPAGHTSGTATVMIAADNEYTLFINGAFIGSGNDFRNAQKYVERVRGPKIVFAVYAVNADSGPNPAGLLASIQVTSSSDRRDTHCGECYSTSYAVTVNDWKAFPGVVPWGFERPGFDDSTWPGAAMEGQNGAAGIPWPYVSPPTKITTVKGSPLPGAPKGS